MEDLNEVIQARRSIRKFQPDDIPDEMIQAIIEAGTHAPSGCNSQCWKFIVVKNKDLLEQIVQAVADTVQAFYRDAAYPAEAIDRRVRQITFFRNAPAVIFVFMTRLDYYDEQAIAYYEQQGYSYRQMQDALGYPDVLSVGAAVQNILLTIQAKGLGACWMNDPIVAAPVISQVLGVGADCRLLSVIPFGKPAYKPRGKFFKPLSEVLEIR